MLPTGMAQKGILGCAVSWSPSAVVLSVIEKTRTQDVDNSWFHL